MQSASNKQTASITQHLSYLLYLPDEYDEASDKEWPLVLFLHGAGERGTDLNLVKKHGLPKKFENGESLPFIVIAPQCSKNDWWADYRQSLIMLVDSVLKSYQADASRVYLTGLSMGGRGSWDLATSYPNRFAAVAPICGWGDGLLGYPERLKRVTHVPIWTFHGDADEVVSIKGTQLLVDALEEYGGNIKFTIYPDVGHDSWTETYDNPQLYDWFLQHTL